MGGCVMWSADHVWYAGATLVCERFYQACLTVAVLHPSNPGRRDISRKIVADRGSIRTFVLSGSNKNEVIPALAAAWIPNALSSTTAQSLGETRI
jgi:hypothetical protein